MDKTSVENPGFLKYHLKADLLCLGERIRGSVFRPCLDVFTYTALVGALKARFPHPCRKLHAVGRFIPNGPGSNKPEIMIFSPRDRSREISVTPLEIGYLANVNAEIFILKNDFTVKFPDEFLFRLGAMKSKGFGQCYMTRIAEVSLPHPKDVKKGKLNVRIPDDQQILNELGIQEVISPIYGYLFQPKTGGTGRYIRALFQDSYVKANPILLNEE